MQRVNKKRALVAVALAVTLTLSLAPVLALGQERPYTYGPRVDELDCIIFKDPETELMALLDGRIDIMDWPVPPAKVEEVLANPALDVLTFPDWGYFYIGLNLRRHPLDDVNFRRALAYLIPYDRILSEVLMGYGEILPAGLVNTAYGGWRNPNITKYTFDPKKAAAILDAAGYVMGPTGVRIDPATGKPLREIELLARSDDPNRLYSAYYFADEAKKVGVPIKVVPQDRKYIAAQVYEKYDYDMFTGGWTLGSDVDWLYDFFHSSRLPEEHNMEPWWFNFVGFRNATYDEWAEKVKFSMDPEVVKEAAWKCQEILAEQLPYLPLYSAYNIIPATKEFTGYVIRSGSTSATLWWSALNVHPRTAPFGGKFRIGFKSTIESLNPYIAEWYWDWLVLGELFDGMVSMDPYTSEDMPWVATSWTSEPWTTPEGAKGMKFTFKLRDDVYFQDGKKLTAEDVAFSLLFLKGSPYWVSLLEHVVDAKAVDPTTVEVYLDVQSYWALHWVGGAIILPKHVWEAVKDPLHWDYMEGIKKHELFGTGPFKIVEYKPDEYARLVYFENYFRLPAERRLYVSTEIPTATAAVVPAVTLGEKATISVLVKDPTGKPVTTATVQVTIRDEAGAVKFSGTAGHVGSGVYELTVDTSQLGTGTFELEVAASYGALRTTSVKAFEVKAPVTPPVALPVPGAKTFAAASFAPAAITPTEIAPSNTTAVLGAAVAGVVIGLAIGFAVKRKPAV